MRDGVNEDGSRTGTSSTEGEEDILSGTKHLFVKILNFLGPRDF